MDTVESLHTKARLWGPGLGSYSESSPSCTQPLRLSSDGSLGVRGSPTLGSLELLGHPRMTLPQALVTERSLSPLHLEDHNTLNVCGVAWLAGLRPASRVVLAPVYPSLGLTWPPSGQGRGLHPAHPRRALRS